MATNVRSERIDSADVLAEVERLKSLLLECRAVFPTLSADLVGQRVFQTAPYYRSRGYRAEIHLKQPISTDFIHRQRQLGRWINENAVIRLFGILNYHGFFKKLDPSLPGHREMDLLRRMRNAFTKTPLNYQPNDPKNRRLREALIEHFKLEGPDIQEEIPVPINKVLEPIFTACRDYVVARGNAHNDRMEPTGDGA